MKRFGLTVLAAGVCGLLGGETAAWAQGPLQPGISTPLYRPGISPYINLLRNTNTFNNNFGVQNAINYYGLVRPEIGFSSAIGGLGAQVDINQALLASGGYGPYGPGSGLIVTGHGAYFLNNGGYFLTTSRFGRGGSGTGSFANAQNIGRSTLLNSSNALTTGAGASGFFGSSSGLRIGFSQSSGAATGAIRR
jgi:hypothetical protein